MATHSSSPARRTPWPQGPRGLRSTGSQREQLSAHAHTSRKKKKSNNLTSIFSFPPVSKLLSLEATTLSSRLLPFQNILCMYKQIFMWIFVYMHKYSKKLYNASFYTNGTTRPGFPACFYSLSSETLCMLRQGRWMLSFHTVCAYTIFYLFFSKLFWFFKNCIYLGGA